MIIHVTHVALYVRTAPRLAKAKGQELTSIYDFFIGTALHPRVGKLVDVPRSHTKEGCESEVKMVAETRVSWTLLLLITVSCLLAKEISREEPRLPAVAA